MRNIQAFEYDGSKAGNTYPCEMTREEWDVVVNDVISDPVLVALKISKFVDVKVSNEDVLAGHRAVCFMDSGNNAQVIFRGTCGDDEWLDNARGMVQANTIQQRATIRFVNEVREDDRLGIRSLTVAGHSKGGNKAQYTAIATPENYVDRCVSLDGQGFSMQFHNKYAEIIKARKNIVDLVAEPRDFVNCLGVYLGETSFYRGRRGDTSGTTPYGGPLPYFHCPDALRAAEGSIGKKFDHGDIPRTLNMLIVYLLKSPIYDNV